MKTLIVEDDFTARVILQSFLTRHGECHIAVNGKEAVEAFRAAMRQGAPYDLVCMDILLPELDGKDAVRQLRALEMERGVLSSDGAKIIMTTSVTDMKVCMQSFYALCDAYLTKPIDLGHLLQHLRAFHLVE